MAYPSSQLDSAKNPQTRCSNCQTVFEVSRELLSSSDTRVRCGECLSIFDALEELRSDAEPTSATAPSAVPTPAKTAPSSAAEESLGGIGGETVALDVTYSDFDLFSEEADLPEIAYFDQTRDTPDFDFDAVDMADDETFSDTLFVHDVTIDADATTLRQKTTAQAEATGGYADIDFVADEQPREPLIFKYRDRQDGAASRQPQASVQTSERPEYIAQTGDDALGEAAAVAPAPVLAEPKRRGTWLFRLGMLALFGLLLGALFAYRTKPQLYNNATVRPVLEVGCKIMRCRLPARVDMSLMQLVKQKVYSHPNVPNALVINVSFVNNADFEQQLPLLHMLLSNRVGRTVARRDFAPADYLPNWQQGDTIPANQQFDVTVEVNDPGRDAQSFEFFLREFKQ